MAKNIVTKWSILDGHTFQDLAADLLMREGFDVQDRGVGPDGGIDMLASQNVALQDNYFKTYKWAVQVKYRLRRSGTVKPQELGNIMNLISRFEADGFLLITNGRVTNKSFSELRSISEGKPPNYHAAVWDNRIVESKLLKHEDIRRKYFGESRSTSILLIDDDPTVLHAISEVLAAIGHTVHRAASPKDALRIAEKYEIDVAIVDIRLDTVSSELLSDSVAFNGIDLAKRIRDVRPGVKIIYYSAYLASAEVASRAGLENAIFLSKFDTDATKLQQIVADTLGTPPEIALKASQFESITTFVNSTLHRAVSTIHAAKALADISRKATRSRQISKLLEISLASIKSVMKDLALENFRSSVEDFAWVSLEDVIRKSVEGTKLTHPGSSIKVVTSALDGNLFCDSRSLEMAIGNLLDNALEASREGSAIEVELRFDILKRERDYACLRILDSGAGITPTMMPRLYLPGFSSKGGSGMGFFLANKVAEFHGGWIEVNSPHKKWSTEIRFHVPLESSLMQHMREDSPVDNRVLNRLKLLGEVKGKDVVRGIISEFIDSVPSLLEILKEASINGDATRVEHIAHSLKGSAGILGAYRLSGVCKSIESIGRGGSVKDIDDKLAELAREYEEVLATFRNESLVEEKGAGKHERVG